MKYAIVHDGGYIKLYSDGYMGITKDPFEAKMMPSKEHALQLAKSLGIPWGHIVELDIKVIHIGIAF